MKKVLTSLSKVYHAKKFTTNMYKIDLEKFKSHLEPDTTEKFIKEYINNNKQANVSSKEDVYSLMLNTALTLKDSKIVNHIFSLNLGNNILVNIDDLSESPIAHILIYGNESLLKQTKKYIDASIYNTVKSTLLEEDFPNILNALEYPRWESFTADRYLDEYIKPLYTESDYQRLVKALGESEA